MNSGDFVSEKEQKYDRQLRLWGEDGQFELENSNICVLGSDSVICETLKNLVLPGLGAFTVIDDAIINDSDVANNFFVTEDDIGKPRAEITTRLLYELNPDVKNANYIAKNSKKVIYEDNFLTRNKFNIVLISETMKCEELLKLADVCSNENISLFIVRIYGLIGYLRLQVPEYPVIELKPDFPVFDLRLHDPIPGMLEYVDKFDFNTISPSEHSHVPFPIILIKALQMWRSQTNRPDTAIPITFEEKQAYKDLILKMSNRSQEENFEEAYDRAFYAYIPYNIPNEVLTIMNHEKARNLNANSSPFWIVISALNKFFSNEGNGKLPLLGSIPDMTSDTGLFIELQNLYKKKASHDVEILAKYTYDTLDELGLSRSAIPLKYIEKIAKNVVYLRYNFFRSLREEYEPGPKNEFFEYINDENLVNQFYWYILLRAADRFYVANNKFPGQDLESDCQCDIVGLEQMVNEILDLYRLPADFVPMREMKEFVRFGGSRLNMMASLMGGITAQEIIKVITHQWIPLNNTVIFNGIDSTSASFKL